MYNSDRLARTFKFEDDWLSLKYNGYFPLDTRKMHSLEFLKSQNATDEW